MNERKINDSIIGMPRCIAEFSLTLSNVTVVKLSRVSRRCNSRSEYGARGGRARRTAQVGRRDEKEGYVDTRREITEEGEERAKTGGADNNV